MLSLILSKEKESKIFWKPSKPGHVGINWIALTEYAQMSTYVPGFHHFLVFCVLFCIGQISHQ